MIKSAVNQAVPKHPKKRCKLMENKYIDIATTLTMFDLEDEG